MATVAIRYLIITKSYIYNSPLLVITAPVIPLYNAGAGCCCTSVHIQGFVAIAVDDTEIPISQIRDLPLLVVTAPKIPLNNGAAIIGRSVIYIQRFTALPAYDPVPG